MSARSSFEIQEDLELARLRHEALRDRPMTAPSPAAAGLPLEDVERVARPWPDAVLVEGDWVSPSREAHARDLTKSWADAAATAGCPAAFVNRMRTFVELHDRLATAALAEMRPTAAGPDPRFRDQLAEVRADLIGDLPGAYPWHEIVDPWLAPDGPIDRLINAQVRARVQASPAPVPPDANGGEER